MIKAIAGLGCACQEQGGTGIRGLGASYTVACGDQPPAASIQYADWYNCYNAQQSNPTPPITSWIAFDASNQPVTVIPKTISTPTVVVPYTAPLPTNQPVVAPYPPSIPVSSNGTPILTGTAIVNNVPPVVVTAPVVSTPIVPVTTAPPVSTVSDPVIGISQTVPTTVTPVGFNIEPGDYLMGGLAVLGLLALPKDYKLLAVLPVAFDLWLRSQVISL